MNRDETRELLATIASFDTRKTYGAADVTAWQTALEDEPSLTDCTAAVITHYRDETRMVMPADVRGRVRQIRRARLEAVVEPVPDIDPDRPREFAAAVRETRRAIADGTMPPPQRLRLEGNRGLPDRFADTFRDARQARQLEQPVDPQAAAATRAAEQTARDEIRRLHEQATQPDDDQAEAQS